ncbi:MAG: hypothetical protein L6R48_24750, partial [Planctomycetes bacterium]|nr:hypothetical protein [Planctomycetota bacterium]
MRLPVVVPLLLSLAALGAAEPVVATPFEVRREVQDWCEEADRAGSADGGVVERAQALLAAHGRLLLASPAGARPVAEVIEERLRARGFDQAFARAWSARAEARLAEARGEDDLLGVALAHPFTPAAARAWRRLADLAWDRGHLGAYLARARRAGDAADPGLGARV